MLGLLIFIIPALWLGYILGRVLREGVAAILFYQMADLTPWLLQNWDKAIISSIILATIGALMMTRSIKWGKWRRTLTAYPFAFSGGIIWLAVCLVYPEGWLSPFQGLVMFSLMTMFPLAGTMAHYTMKSDALAEVFGWLLVIVGAIALLQALVLWTLPV